jgi:putative flippase GtrA
MSVTVNVRRWGVFNLVGLGGFAVQIATIALLTRGVGWSSLAATAVGLELVAVQNFFGHSTWTWQERRVRSPRAWLARFWRYQLAKTASLIANLAITSVLVHAGLPPEIANTAAVLICAVPNYLMSEHFVFQLPASRF